MLNNNRTLFVAAVLIVAAAFAIWHFGDFGTKLTISHAVDDLLHSRNPGQANRALDEAGDRSRVVAALKDALDSSEGDVWGKWQILTTLQRMKESRAVRRAMDSSVVDTQRAAAYIWHNDEEYAPRCRQITLDWIRDEGANYRHLAAEMCQRLKIEEAVPALLAAIEIEPKTQQDRQLVATALAAVLPFKPEGLGPRMFALAENPNADERVRQAALNSLARYPESGVEPAKIQALAIRLLEDRGESQLVRAGCTNVLRTKLYTSAESIAALEKVLMDPGETDVIVQRLCLNGLGDHAPLEELERVVLDPRVYNHPFMGIRTDVAGALAVLNVRKRIALEILCEYLVDSDEKDPQHIVRSEAYLSLFALTGFHHGVKEQGLFQTPPLPLQDPARIREYLWKPMHLRYGISPEQNQAVRKIVGNDAEMRKIRDLARNLTETMIANWAKAEKPDGGPTAGTDGDGSTKDAGADGGDAGKKDGEAEGTEGGAKDGGTDAEEEEKRQSENDDTAPDEPETPPGD